MVILRGGVAMDFITEPNPPASFCADPATDAFRCLVSEAW